MVRTLHKAKGRRQSGTFLRLPHSVWRHPKFAALSPHALKLLIDIAGQYNGRNNGDLSAPYAFLSRERHWRSRDTLGRAMAELLQSGFLVRTRQGKRVDGHGGKHFPSLYALTWEPINVSSKHDMGAPVAPQNWLKEQNPDTVAVTVRPHQYQLSGLGVLSVPKELTELCGVPRHGECFPVPATVLLLRNLPSATHWNSAA